MFGSVPPGDEVASGPGPRWYDEGVGRSSWSSSWLLRRCRARGRRRRSSARAARGTRGTFAADRPQPPRGAGIEDKGAVFVDELDEVPEGAVVVLSPTARDRGPRRCGAPDLSLIDATCPLVTKCTSRRAGSRRTTNDPADRHAGHEEVEGRSGRRRSARYPRAVGREASAVDPRPGSLSYLTIPRSRVDRPANRRRPAVAIPGDRGSPREDIGYDNPEPRQDAVKEVARLADVVLVIGSKNSPTQSTGRGQRSGGPPAYLGTTAD